MLPADAGRPHIPQTLCMPTMHSSLDTMHVKRASSFRQVIATFACRATHQLWLGQRPAQLPPSLHQVALRKLTQLHAATSLQDRVRELILQAYAESEERAAMAS